MPATLAGAPRGPPGNGREADVIPEVAQRNPQSARQGGCLVAAAEADRRLSLGEQADRPVPLVGDDLGRHQAVLDQAAEKAERLRRRPRAQGHAAAREHLRSVRGQERDQAVRGRLAAPRPTGHHDRVRLAVPDERARDGSKLAPGRGRREAESAPARHAGTRNRRRPRTPRRRRSGPSYRFAATSASRKSTSCSSRTQALVQVLECVEEPRRRELGRPDGVEHGEVGRLSFRDRVGQRLVQPRSRDGDDVNLDRSLGAVPDHPRPRAFLGHDDADLGLIGSPAEPVRVHERPAPPVPEDHAFLGELRERAAHRRPADLVAVAELVLGRELSVPCRRRRRGSPREAPSSAGSTGESAGSGRSPSAVGSESKTDATRCPEEVAIRLTPRESICYLRHDNTPARELDERRRGRTNDRWAERPRALGARPRGARVELARSRDTAFPSLPASVELGLGVHRDGVRGLEPGARGDGAPLALRRAVGERAGTAHRLHRG